MARPLATAAIAQPLTPWRPPAVETLLAASAACEPRTWNALEAQTSSAILGCDAPTACVPADCRSANWHPRAHGPRDLCRMPADAERWSWSFPAKRPIGTASLEDRRRPCPPRTCSPGNGLCGRGRSPCRSLAGRAERLQLARPWQRSDGSHRAFSLPGACAYVLQRHAAHTHRCAASRLRGARDSLRRPSWREVGTHQAGPHASALADCTSPKGRPRARGGRAELAIPTTRPSTAHATPAAPIPQ